MSGNNLPKQILVIDDDSTVGQAVEGPLSGYNVAVANSQDFETAMYQFSNEEFDVVFIELGFEELHGLALVQKFREHASAEKRGTAFVLMSGKTRPASDDNLIRELMDVEIIIKPFTLVQILPYLSRGIAIKQRLVKYEMFREKLYKLIDAGQAEIAIKESMNLIGQLGQRGVKLVCELYEHANLIEPGYNFIHPIAEKNRGNLLFEYLEGRFLRLMGRFQEAQGILEKVYNASPMHINRLEDMWELYMGLDQPDKAIEKMKELLKLTPEHQDIKFDWFERLIDAGYEEQAKEFCKATTKPMDVIRYYNNRGVEFSRVGDIEGAIREYERAIQFFPNFKENYRIHYNIALAQTKTKSRQSYAKAAVSLEKAIALKPDFDKAKKTLESINKALKKKSA